MTSRVLTLAWMTILLAACGAPEAPRPEAPEPPPATERTDTEPAPRDADIRDAVRTAAAGDHRPDANRARDRYRNPVETLAFFGLEPGHRVVEIWPGAGWYTEILAPVLRDRGTLVVANFPADPEGGMIGRIGQAMLDKLEADPGTYDRVEVVTFQPPEQASLGEDEGADLVLLSRHFHNLIARDAHHDVLAAAHAVLKPGGVLGVIQHRLPAEREFDPDARTGYVPEAFVIEAAEQAGFELAARSEINANPLDDADHEQGVWALPPTLAACRDLEDDTERQRCQERFEAIGESDRMTLKFVKP